MLELKALGEYTARLSDYAFCRFVIVEGNHDANLLGEIISINGRECRVKGVKTNIAALVTEFPDEDGNY